MVELRDVLPFFIADFCPSGGDLLYGGEIKCQSIKCDHILWVCVTCAENVISCLSNGKAQQDKLLSVRARVCVAKWLQMHVCTYCVMYVSPTAQSFSLIAP